MQPDDRRVILARLCPALFELVLTGLMLVALGALVPAGPAFAGEVTAGVPAVPWHRPLADHGNAGLQQYSAVSPGLTGFELVAREAVDGVPWRGILLRAGGGLRIGAQGSFDPGSGSLRAIVALKLDF